MWGEFFSCYSSSHKHSSTVYVQGISGIPKAPFLALSLSVCSVHPISAQTQIFHLWPRSAQVLCVPLSRFTTSACYAAGVNCRGLPQQFPFLSPRLGSSFANALVGHFLVDPKWSNPTQLCGAFLVFMPYLPARLQVWKGRLCHFHVPDPHHSLPRCPLSCVL